MEKNYHFFHGSFRVMMKFNVEEARKIVRETATCFGMVSCLDFDYDETEERKCLWKISMNAKFRF